jgi:hypothetical protein
MQPNATPPSGGINWWQIATTILSASLVAALTGVFSMYGKQGLLEERVNTQKETIARNQTELADLRKDFNTFKETTNTRLNTVDAVKLSFDNLTRYAERDRR